MEHSLAIPDYEMMLHAVDVELSGYCNAACVFCPRDKMTRKQTVMPQNVFKKLIQEIARIRPAGPRTIFFCGLGEPLINKYIFEYAGYINEIFPKTHIVVVSNGGLLNKDICDALMSSGIHWFSCSMQATDKDSYETSMQGLQFDQIMHWLQYMVTRGNRTDLNISVSYVRTNQTDLEIEEYQKFWEKLGVPVGENKLQNRGGFLETGTKTCQTRNSCLLFNSRTFIAANGDVLACCNDLDGKTRLGNITTDHLEDILHNKLEYVLKKHLFPICAVCNDESAFQSFPRVVETAFQLQQAGHYSQAEELYRRVLKIDPDNVEALHYLGTLMHHLGKHGEALELLEKATCFQANPFIYNNLGAVYKKLGRLKDAENSFRSALQCNPDFAGAYANLGDVLNDQGCLVEAETAFRQLLSLEPGWSDVWFALGNVLQVKGDLIEALTAYKEAIAKRPDYAEAYLNSAAVLKKLGRIEEAVLACKQALSLDTEFSEAYSMLGIMLYESGSMDEAEDALQQSLFLQPENVVAYSNLGNLLRVRGRYDEAENACRMALAIDPSSAYAYCNLGNILCERGRLDEGEHAYRKALELKSDFAEAYCNLGIVLFEMGRLDESDQAYRNALELDPLLIEAYCNISSLYRERGWLEEAEDACREALLIMPDCAEALNNLSVVLLDLSYLEEAESACRRALEIKPNFAEAHCSLGNVLCGLERTEDAIAAYNKSLECKPEYAEAYSNLGNALVESGRYEEAKYALLQALQLKPSLHACRIKLAMLSLPLMVSSIEEAVAVPVQFARSLDDLDISANRFGFSVMGKDIGALQPFNLAYRLGDHSQLLSRYGDIICMCREAWIKQYSNCAISLRPLQRERIRLLIVTGQVRRHSVWDVILHGLLRNLDRSRFEVILYHTISKQDDETVRARSLVDCFVQGPADWLRMARDVAPDIIFYPEIGMDAATLELAATRLAPIQIASWGHPITTGLPTIDFFFSGELLEHKDADSDYRERLVRLPGTGACSVLMPYQAKAPASDIINAPCHINSTKFLICQQAIKFDPAFDEVYLLIAQRSGPCCFYFVRDRKYGWASDMLEKRIVKIFKDAGMPPEDFIRFVEWLPGDEFWGLMDMMDIYLDVPAFSGYTTAWQAIHRGLPVVTCEGRYLRQRLAGGLLRKIGITETIASGIEEYVDIASSLAKSPDERRKLKEILCNNATIANEDTAVVRAFESFLFEQYNNTVEVIHADDN